MLSSTACAAGQGGGEEGVVVVVLRVFFVQGFQKISYQLHGCTLLFQLVCLQMIIGLGKGLAGCRLVINATVQYLAFAYFALSGQNKLSVCKEKWT